MSSTELMQTSSVGQLLGTAQNTEVLVAEDDPLFRHVLESWLRNWHYTVTVVEDGLKAWEALQAGTAPTLLVLDWMMPGIDGIELCRRIRARKQVIYPYVLLLTSKDDKQDLVHALEVGADDYLTKPFDVNELRARLRVGTRTLALQAELIAAREELRFQAMHDRLTGLWSRDAVLEFLGRELDRAKRAGDSLGVIMVDVDHFKAVNDSGGHLIGDAVLKEVAQRLAKFGRAYDWVGRYGGEEFLIVASNCNLEDIEKFAERMRVNIANKPIMTGMGEISVTASFGAAVAAQDPYPSQDSLLTRADSALYRAKREGRNRVEMG
jgi:two-component system cell cycle response regulator